METKGIAGNREKNPAYATAKNSHSLRLLVATTACRMGVDCRNIR